MNQLNTTGIVLRRTDYGEADRIVLLLTPEYGKLSLIAKGVRRQKSKLAGGIELFSVSSLTFIKGRSDLGTLVSARLDKHFGTIVKDIGRVQLGYELIKVLNKATEDAAEADYFDLLQRSFAALDDATVNTSLIHVWFWAQLLRFGGHTPNLQTDSEDQKLDAAKKYNLDTESMLLTEHTAGSLNADKIKFLRLLFSDASPLVLSKVSGGEDLAKQLLTLVQTMLATHIRT